MSCCLLAEQDTRARLIPDKPVFSCGSRLLARTMRSQEMRQLTKGQASGTDGQAMELISTTCPCHSARVTMLQPATGTSFMAALMAALPIEVMGQQARSALTHPLSMLPMDSQLRAMLSRAQLASLPKIMCIPPRVSTPPQSLVNLVRHSQADLLRLKEPLLGIPGSMIVQ